MVARALLLRPKLIVADEPVSMVDASLRATILGSLRKLNQELGISILYITHDLATAYQVSDTILVMYRARVAEAGDVEQVVQRPNHPYTKLLLSAIPKVSTTRDWLMPESRENAATVQGEAGAGCGFADRCSLVTDLCRGSQPPLFQVSDRQAVACFAYRTAPRLDAAGLDRVLTA
jgi:peptide/nickel transport system ATP-binding protein